MEHDGCKGCRYERENSDSIHCQGCKQNAVDKYAKMTNADKIRSMTDEELAESRIDRIDIYLKSDTQMWTGDFSGIAESKGEALKLEKKWLESECDAE